MVDQCDPFPLSQTVSVALVLSVCPFLYKICIYAEPAKKKCPSLDRSVQGEPCIFRFNKVTILPARDESLQFYGLYSHYSPSKENVSTV